MEFDIESPSTDRTIQIGEELGRLLKAGDVVGLVGDLGAGKTWLAKGIAYGAGVPRHEYVNSPAYDIVHEYPGNFPVYHMDFYRIDDIGQDEYLWLEEYFERDGVCIAEWADKFLSELCDDYLRINIEWNMLTDVRALHIVGSGDRYGRLVEQLKECTSANSQS